MIYYDVKPLGELIKAFYEERRGPDYLDEVKLMESWPNVVGSFIASHTIDLSIRNRVLFVRVDSDALRSELNYSKSLLLKHLNDEAGKEIVTEIVLN
jgi:predicted nucleic acid-binding Zn ribbon protein